MFGGSALTGSASAGSLSRAASGGRLLSGCLPDENSVSTLVLLESEWSLVRL
ncbi:MULTISPECIES: hypothetical protein [Actinoalloteichus]|uniref:hypothetical protein n=1 Tax=Actinoalloteichus TaxID=65496 RepID=UPI0012FB914D|nr:MULTISPECIES: hypothetical protein [Actinoalloteichus]